MAKLLQLDAIKSYVGPRTENTLIAKGQVVRVDDEVAEKLLEGYEIEIGGDGNIKHHWIEKPEGTPFHYDFTGGSVKVGKAGQEVQAEEDDPSATQTEDPKPEAKPPVAKRAAPQRKQPARPAARSK